MWSRGQAVFQAVSAAGSRDGAANMPPCWPVHRQSNFDQNWELSSWETWNSNSKSYSFELSFQTFRFLLRLSYSERRYFRNHGYCNQPLIVITFQTFNFILIIIIIRWNHFLIGPKVIKLNGFCLFGEVLFIFVYTLLWNSCTSWIFWLLVTKLNFEYL